MNNHPDSVNDLIHNQSFRRVAKGVGSPQEIDRWSAWMEASEQNRLIAKKAIAEISGFKFDDPSDIDFENEWTRLYKSTVGRQNFHSINSLENNFGLRMIYSVAAVVLIISLVGTGFYIYSEPRPEQPKLEEITQEETVKTKEGQQKRLKFTNNSKAARIILNENSALTYRVGLLHNESIEITLQGEAFFDVDPGFSEGHSTFSVSTPDGVIEDLGTEFLVTVGEDHSRVVLQEGIVKVKAMADNQAGNEFEISKGQMVEFSKSDIIRRQSVNSSFYTSWATGSMQFNETKVSDFAEYVKQRFDVEVILKNSALKDVTLEGAVYFKSLEGLLRSIRDIAQIPVYQSCTRDTVYIGNHYNSNLIK